MAAIDHPDDDGPLHLAEERLVPHGRLAGVRIGPVLDGDVRWRERLLARLGAREREAAAPMGAARLATWAAGRTALRHALTAAGAPPALAADLPADARGAPQLPADWLGSVSHKGTWAVALAAPRPGGAGYAGLGVDVEWLPDADGDHPDIARRVLTDAEAGALAALDRLARRRAVLLRFSLKEAVYKAVAPLARRWIGFREVEVWPGPTGLVEVAHAIPEVHAAGVAIAAWYAVEADRVVTSAVARAG